MKLIFKFCAIGFALATLSGCRISEYKNSPIKKIAQLKESIPLRTLEKNTSRKLMNKALSLLLEPSAKITVYQHDKDTIYVKNISYENLSTKLSMGQENDIVYIVQEGKTNNNSITSSISFDLYIPEKTNLTIQGNSVQLKGNINLENLKINAGSITLVGPEVQVHKNIRLSAGSAVVKSNLVAKDEIYISSGKCTIENGYINAKKFTISSGIDKINSAHIKAQKISISSGLTSITCDSIYCTKARFSSGRINAHMYFNKIDSIKVSSGRISGKIMVPQKTEILGGKDVKDFITIV